MRDFVRRHPILTYVALAYAISWAFWIPLALKGARIIPGGSVTHFPGLLGPAVAAFLTTALVDGIAGVRGLVRKMFLVSQPPGRFWLYSLSPLLFLGLALAISVIQGALPSQVGFATYSGLPVLPLGVVVLLVLLFNGFGEETGWRGFALGRLQQRFGPLTGALLLGLIWAGWHIPAFWTVEGYRSMSVPMLIGGFGLGICAGSVVLARVGNRTRGSVLAAALWHLTYNIGSATAASRGVIGAVTTTCVMLWAILLIVQEARRGTQPSRLLVEATD